MVAWTDQTAPMRNRTCKHLKNYLGEDFEQARIAGGKIPPSTPSKKAVGRSSTPAPAVEEKVPTCSRAGRGAKPDPALPPSLQKSSKESVDQEEEAATERRRASGKKGASSRRSSASQDREAEPTAEKKDAKPSSSWKQDSGPAQLYAQYLADASASGRAPVAEKHEGVVEGFSRHHSVRSTSRGASKSKDADSDEDAEFWGEKPKTDWEAEAKRATAKGYTAQYGPDSPKGTSFSSPEMQRREATSPKLASSAESRGVRRGGNKDSASVGDATAVKEKSAKELEDEDAEFWGEKPKTDWAAEASRATSDGYTAQYGPDSPKGTSFSSPEMQRREATSPKLASSAESRGAGRTLAQKPPPVVEKAETPPLVEVEEEAQKLADETKRQTEAKSRADALAEAAARRGSGRRGARFAKRQADEVASSVADPQADEVATTLPKNSTQEEQEMLDAHIMSELDNLEKHARSPCRRMSSQSITKADLSILESDSD